ncbi:hypothetical protein T484DRAFT_1885413 [Baffinella frigidus]|nr:hypothetical protein T484DRAFT_1885413 [Cryptophyta sp. CCMP2293]
MSVGANVARMARVEDAYSHAQRGVKETKSMTASALWHEQQNIRTLSKSLSRARDRAEMSEEHAEAAREMMFRRAQRLKELLSFENDIDNVDRGSGRGCSECEKGKCAE